MAKLTESQLFVLRWLAEKEFSSYGECRGSDLDVLVTMGFARVGGADTRGDDYRLVSVTVAGFEHLRELARDQ